MLVFAWFAGASANARTSSGAIIRAISLPETASKATTSGHCSSATLLPRSLLFIVEHFCAQCSFYNDLRGEYFEKLSLCLPESLLKSVRQLNPHALSLFMLESSPTRVMGSVVSQIATHELVCARNEFVASAVARRQARLREIRSEIEHGKTGGGTGQIGQPLVTLVQNRMSQLGTPVPPRKGGCGVPLMPPGNA